MEVNLILWSTIESEVETFQNGYRSGFVAIFKKYEGQETDELDGQGRKVVVSATSFAAHFGVAGRTFRQWVAQEAGRPGHAGTREGISERQAKAVAEASAKAKAEAEAKHQKDLADALERQRKASEQAQREALLREREAAERRAKEDALRIRAEEQAKAKEAAAKEIAELKAKLSDTAKSAGFDVSTMSEAQKAQVMTMLANDPEKAKSWFAAQTAERTRKLAEAETKAKADAAKKRQQLEEREARQAAERARSDYNSSALRLFLDLAKEAKTVKERLSNKAITFDHILASGMSAQEWVSLTEMVEDVAVEIREAIFSVNAEQELSDITE